MTQYVIHCEADELYFDYQGEVNGMIHLIMNRLSYYYEAGDNYLYSEPDGGESHYLGDVFSYGTV